MWLFKMKVKDLKKTLEQVDENLEIYFHNRFNLIEIENIKISNNKLILSKAELWENCE